MDRFDTNDRDYLPGNWQEAALNWLEQVERSFRNFALRRSGGEPAPHPREPERVGAERPGE
jgi:hypothetical protein